MSRLEAAVQAARESGDYDLFLAELPYARFLGLKARLVDDLVVLRLPFQQSRVGSMTHAAYHGGGVGACLECAALLQLVHVHGLPLPRTIDFTVDYLRLARGAELCAEAEVQRLGRRVANVRMRAYQVESPESVALGRGNFLLG